MASIAALRAGIQARVQTITGLRAYDVEAGNEQLPCAIIYPFGDGGYWKTTNAGCNTEYDFDVVLHVSLAAGLDKAQRTLDGYIDHPSVVGSVAYAIAAGPTLGGVATVAIARRHSAYSFGELNATRTLMAIIRVNVQA